MERLAWASLWGTGLALAVALLCRVFPKLPASVRFWLWWAVPAKLLLGLLAPVSLAVLPASHATLARSGSTPTHSRAIAVLSTPIRLPSRSAPALSKGVPALSHNVFALVWLLGAVVTLGIALVPAIRLSRRLRGAGGRGAGGWRELADTGPLVFGLLRPIIVLPTGLSEAERRLALAHERAHLTRRDPWLALVPLAARVVFWFVPTVYAVEWALATAREEACDALARQATGASAREYGALLLKLTPSASKSAGSLAMASPVYAQLQSRLLTLAAPQRRVPAWPLLVPGALVLPGWTLAERARAARNVSTQQPLAYERRNLPTLGGRYSDAFAITDAGRVVGSANGRDGRGRATLWDKGKPQVLDSDRSIAFALSETGDVALSTLTADKRPSAHWLRGGARQDLPGLSGFPDAVAVAVTDSGMLVGSARSRDGVGTRAVLWENGTVRALGTLGGPFSQAAAVSRSGWIVGKADVSPTETHAFVYDGAQLRDLGTLGGRNSRATAVNAAGQVVGMSETAGGERRAFVWSAQTGMRALPGTDGIALALADDGTVAGQAQGHAALWRSDGTRVALDPSLVVVRGINRRGELVGQGWVGEDLRGFRLTPAAATTASTIR